MYCPNCQASLHPSDRFCARCGAEIAHAPIAAVPAPAPATPRSRHPFAFGTIAVVLLVIAAGVGVAIGHHSDHKPTKVLAVTTTKTADPAPTPKPTPTPVAPTFASLYDAVSNGVVRIETTSCDGKATGTGFLLSPTLVATVAHVVNGARNVVVRTATGSTTGTVVGINPARELALVQVATPIEGHIFQLAKSDPKVGDDVAAIGYPLAGPQSFTKGTVSGLGRTITVEGTKLDDVLQTDTPLNPGNSGGPIMTVDGTVVGLDEAGNVDAQNLNYAIPATDAADVLAAWEQEPSPVTVPACDDSSNSQNTANVYDDSKSTDGPAIAKMFTEYANGINHGDYTSAYAELDAHEHALVSLDAFTNGNQSSVLDYFDITSVTPTSAGISAEVSFSSAQDDNSQGESCENWDMTYALSTGGDAGWLIDKATPHPGSPSAADCES